MSCVNCSGAQTYSGAASWFCCGPDGYDGYCGDYGSGACGDCDSPNWQCAWQTLDGYPTCYRSCPTGLSCGDCVIVDSPGPSCSWPSIEVHVADHGPGACSGCGNDCAGYCGRIIDLTPAAFAQLNDLSVGVISAGVATCCGCWGA